ncbi:SDR family NAD(P)-dependent oxidoreductase [Salinibacterium hongtaonis]|uniref:SDR family NAD(P)-dependent oxidoreductase n=1 Tax=Homoserinimonas hongtaonis TaxID=2079791 RepID=UPI000D39C01F|nr:SDR family NAD(P)-dependent oxidoreductase [Salinibacterium hongtaonis]AWB89754.1 hypothetical protein C2138_09595 [Salinibacterium hongtaonis]
MPGKLDNKIAVIIGGGQNLGRSIARLFAAEGATPVVVGRTQAKLDAVVDEITEAGGTASAVVADVNSVADLDRLVAEVTAAHGGFDVLVASAGIFLNPEFAETTEDEWDQILDINLKSVFFAVQKSAPVISARGGGSIILMSSVMGVKGRPGSAVYSAAKAGVIGLTKGLAVELGPLGIRVNAIAPGFTLEPDQEHTIPDFIVAEMTKGLPAGRPGLAVEIARATLYVASDDASFLTGQTIFVDGGETAR